MGPLLQKHGASDRTVLPLQPAAFWSLMGHLMSSLVERQTHLCLLLKTVPKCLLAKAGGFSMHSLSQ